MKRKILALFASLPVLSACSANSGNLSSDPEDVRLRKKFQGIYGLVLRLDGSPPAKRGVTITNDRGQVIDSPASVGPKNVSNLTYTDNSMPIPKTVRAIWRKGGGWSDIPIGDPRRNLYRSGIIPPSVKLLEGDIAGDYTVPVAERIPDSVLDYIRKNGGALRLKIRLADDGILIGWDVERRTPQPNCVKTPGNTCFQLEYFMTGGDFKEYRPAHFTGDSTFPYPIPLPMSEENKAFLEKHGLERWYNGDIWEKGWYIDKKTGKKIYVDY